MTVLHLLNNSSLQEYTCTFTPFLIIDGQIQIHLILSINCQFKDMNTLSVHPP